MASLDAALAWAARGFRVFPLRENGTKPIWEGWTDTATADAATIRAWWAGAKWNIGVLTTGLLVVDVDVKKGRAGLESWAALHGGFDTLTVRTPSGGYHLYYYGADVALSVGALGPGLDIRSHNGYVVAPGSVVNGRYYTIEIDGWMERAPAHIVARCKAPGQRQDNTGAVVEMDSPTAIKMAIEHTTRAQGAIQGEQSERAFKLAAAVRDYGISEAMCATIMEPWAARCAPPIMPDDLRHRVANAYHYAQNAAGTKSPEHVFSGVVIEPPVLTPPAVDHGDISFGNAIHQRDLKPRPHVIKGLLMLRDITVLVAPGGVGKSLLSLTIAACLAVGADCLGYQNVTGRPMKSIIYDAEDDVAEMSARLNAICYTMQVDFERVRPQIALLSGKDGRSLSLVKGGPQMSLNMEDFEYLIKAAADPEVAMLAMGPLNSLHELNGSDNIVMAYVMKALNALAGRTNVALLLQHHTSKPQGGSFRGDSQHISQGAEQIVNAGRRTLNLLPPQEDDIKHYGLSAKEREMFVKLQGAKSNYTLAGGEPLWLRKVSVTLVNGEQVGSFEKADMHARTEHMRRALATVLARQMVNTKGSAGVSLLDAARLLKHGDPLFEKMSLDSLKQRIQSYLVEPVTLDDGTRVLCTDTAGSSWMVVIE